MTARVPMMAVNIDVAIPMESVGGIDRHTGGENDSCDTGQRQRRLQHRQHGDDHDQVESEREIRHQAEHPVIDPHENEHENEADNDGAETLLDVLLAKARPHGALLDNLDGRGERASAQQQRQIARFFGIIQSSDLKTFAKLILFSMNTVAIGRPILSRVRFENRLAPFPSKVMNTAGVPVCESRPDDASVM